MRVSVVIPTLNEQNYVGSLLRSLSEQTRKADEVIVVDGRSRDATVRVVEGCPDVSLLSSPPSVAAQRNLGGQTATGDVLIFLDADVRLPATFLEKLVREFAREGLDIACPLYTPYRSTLPVNLFFGFVNVLHRGVQNTGLASGAGHCIAVGKEVFARSGGFDPGLKFDDAEFVRRVSKNHRFRIVKEQVFVSDRRWRKYGFFRLALTYSVMWFLFALNKFHWANHIEYEWGGFAP